MGTKREDGGVNVNSGGRDVTELGALERHLEDMERAGLLERTADAAPLQQVHRAPLSDKHFCAGNACPGLDYAPARPDRPHPPSCLGPTQTHGGRTRAELEREAADRQIEAVEGRPAEDVRALELGAAHPNIAAAHITAERLTDAQLNEQQRQAFGERPADLRELVDGLLGKETPESRAAIERYFGEPITGTPSLKALAHYARHTSLELRAKVHAALERFDPIRNTSDKPLKVFVGIPAMRVDSVHVDGERFERPGKLAAKHGPDAFPTEREAEALAFCFRVALEHDHGGAKRLRRLLYAWHNAAELGGFDFADLWSLDDEYRAHALTVINMIARSPQGWYAEHYGYAADMAAIVDTYGPAVRK